MYKFTTKKLLEGEKNTFVFKYPATLSTFSSENAFLKIRRKLKN